MKYPNSRIVFSIISLLVGLFFLYIGWEAYSEYAREGKYTGFATAYVTKKHYQRASDGNSIYYLEYSFVLANGRKIISKRDVLKEHWDILKVNDALKIRYDKSSPDRNIPLAGGGMSLAYIFFVSLLGAVFCVFGIMRFFADFARKNRKPQ